MIVENLQFSSENIITETSAAAVAKPEGVLFVLREAHDDMVRIAASWPYIMYLNALRSRPGRLESYDGAE